MDVLRERLGEGYRADVSIAVRGAAPSMGSGAGAETVRDPTHPAEEPAAVPHLPAGERLGDWVGRYRLLDVIGEGGFGIVYHAEQREPIERQVALKLIKPGMDTKSVLARFESERQMLALLRHENIAAIYDAGATERGRPYFVMELVRGEPITQYCDRHRLTLEERLELFALVCDGVHHAHQKGLVHRDLSPDNILVEIRGGTAMPKIIDFGVAKAIDRRLTEMTISLERGVLIGKPEYMSPEQAEMNNLDIDQRSDIYSLGVVLYELLAGVLPIGRRELRLCGPEEMVAAIRYAKRPTPRTRVSSLTGEQSRDVAFLRHTELPSLVRRLEGRVQFLAMTALREDRTKRFTSAHAMASDVRRYLADEPFVEAAAETFWERIGYAVRRWWGASAARRGRIAMRRAIESRIEAESARMAAERAQREAEAAAERERRAREKYERQQGPSQLSAYCTAIRAARRALDANNVKEAFQQLEAAPAEHRGWEWRYLWCQADASVAVLDGHESPAWFASIGSRDECVISACTQAVRIWRIGAQAPVVVLRDGWPFTCAAQSADGAHIAAGLVDGRLRLWSAADGLETAAIKAHSRKVNTVAFSPCGRYLLTGSADGMIRVWDRTDWALLRTHRTGFGEVTYAEFSHDSSRVLAVSARVVRIWTALESWDPIVIRAEQTVRSARFSPDSTRVAVAAGAVVCIHHVPSGSLVTSETVRGGEIGTVGFSSDGLCILTTTSTGTRLWLIGEGEYVSNMPSGRAWTTAAAFSPDGSQIVTGASDGTVDRWCRSTGRRLGTLRGHTDAVRTLAFSCDGSLCVTAASDSTLRLWKTSEQATLRGHKAGKLAVSYSSDGRHIMAVSPNGTARIWNVETRAEVATVRTGGSGALAAALSADCARIITAAPDGTVQTWDVRSGNELFAYVRKRSMSSATFSRDASKLIAVSEEGTPILCDLEGGMERVLVDGEGTRGMHERATVGSAPQATPLSGVSIAAFSNDGLTIALVRNKRWVYFLELTRTRARESNYARLVLAGETDITAVAICQMSRRIACGFVDGTVRLLG